MGMGVLSVRLHLHGELPVQSCNRILPSTVPRHGRAVLELASLHWGRQLSVCRCMRHGQRHGKACAACLARMNAQHSTESHNPFSHSQEPEGPSPAVSLSRKANTVIFHPQVQHSVPDFELHAEVLRLGVFGYVMQRLLDGTVNRDFDL